MPFLDKHLPSAEELRAEGRRNRPRRPGRRRHRGRAGALQQAVPPTRPTTRRAALTTSAAAAAGPRGRRQGGLRPGDRQAEGLAPPGRAQGLDGCSRFCEAAGANGAGVGPNLMQRLPPTSVISRRATAAPAGSMAQQRWTDAMDELLEILMRDRAGTRRPRARPISPSGAHQALSGQGRRGPDPARGSGAGQLPPGLSSVVLS